MNHIRDVKCTDYSYGKIATLTPSVARQVKKLRFRNK